MKSIINKVIKAIAKYMILLKVKFWLKKFWLKKFKTKQIYISNLDGVNYIYNF